MGRHLKVEEPPPPKDKPRWRFLVAIGGIVVLAFVSMAAVAALFPQRGSQAVAGPETSNPFPHLPGDPTGGTSPSGGPTPDPGQTPASTPPRGSASRPPNAPSGQLSGAYTVLPNAVWETGFQAQVAITNNTGSAQSWQVRLVYPASVTRYVTSWVDGSPGPRAEVSGQTVIFSGTATVPIGRTIGLKFQFDRTKGGDFSPIECSVNGRACTVG